MNVNALEKAALELEQAAERLRQMAPDLLLPCEDYTILEALQAVRAAVGPEAFVQIRPASINWYNGRNKPEAGEWTIWDGTSSYEGSTLTGAVGLCLASHAAAAKDDAEDAEDAVARVQELLEPVTAVAF